MDIAAAPATLLAFKPSYWITQTILMGITAFLIPKLRVTSIFGPLLTVVALAFINSTVWSTALFFQVPDRFSTQILVLLLSNGVIFWVLAKLLPGIEVDGILAAIVAPVVFTVLSLAVDRYHEQIPWSKLSDMCLYSIEQAKGYATHSASSTASHGHH